MQRPLKPTDKTILKMLKDLITLWTKKKVCTVRYYL